MKIPFKHYGKIIIAIFVAFCIVKIVSPALFIAGTPRYNPNFLVSLRKLVGGVSDKGKIMLASLSNLIKRPSTPGQTEEKKYLAPVGFNPDTVIFKQMAKGVYAGEDKITKKKYIRIDTGVKVKITEYQYKGQTLILYEPEMK